MSMPVENRQSSSSPRQIVFTDNERAMLSETLRFVAEQAWRVSGTGFFSELVSYLGESLNVAFAFCDMIDPDDDMTVETLALFAHGEITKNIRYSLKHTPCENVVGREFCWYAENVQVLFPDDNLLTEMNAESYAGMPLWSADGTALGLIAVMDDKPLKSRELVQTVLQIVAMRAGAELERLQDVTRLQSSQQRFLDFATVSSDWFWETDADLRFSYFSDRFEGVTGVPPAQLLGKTRDEVGAPGASADAYEQLLDDMKAHRPFRDFQHHRIKPNGERAYLSISGQPAVDENGLFIGFRGVGREISEQKLVERELIESRDAARRANEAKSEFLASMSHELRTPLNAVLGFAQMLLHDPRQKLSTPQTEHVECILTGGGHLLDLVNDVLDLARIEADQIVLSIKEVVANDVVKTCISQSVSLGKEHRIEIVDHFSDGASVLLRTDQVRLNQVLLNLLSNAVKFNRNDGTVTLEGEIIDRRFLRLSVSDTGIGIKADDKDNVFQMFHRLGADAMLAREGTGIGLTVTKFLVERMGGSIDFYSKEGIGSTFSINLPLSTNQEILIWTDDLRVGIDAIDKDHQVIVGLLNKIAHESHGTGNASKTIKEMIGYTQYHFLREEAIMETSKYPNLESHRKQHRDLISQIHQMAELHSVENDAQTPTELGRFLRDWWTHHILDVDMKLTKFTAGKEQKISEVLSRIG
jgi:hemerythrin-like metal-binding protein/PAS domain S-box-containing protein